MLKYPPTQYFSLNPPIIPKSNPKAVPWPEEKPSLPSPVAPEDSACSHDKILTLYPNANDEFLSFCKNTPLLIDKEFSEDNFTPLYSVEKD